MSKNVIDTGMMAILKTPVKYEEVSEILWENGSNLHVNYEGTLIYSTDQNADCDGYGIVFGLVDTSKEFYKSLAEQNFEIVEGSARPYRCYWYNGVDSDMDTLTLEKFKERIS